MVRTRLATLTLAGSLLLTSSGCFGLLERFQSWRHGGAADCTCMEGGAYGDVPIGADIPVTGPVLVSPGPTFTGPPPTGVYPQGPPPRIVPIPAQSAQPMPWTGHN